MKITKTQPLRPRGRSEEKRQSTKNAIRKERRYRKRRSTHRKPRIVVKGVLSGFMIVDSSWDEEYVDSLLFSVTQKPEPASVAAEEDHNFMVIEKE